MIVAIDIGNTRIKAAVFEGDTLVKRVSFLATVLQKEIENILNEFQNIDFLVVASVSNVNKQLFLDFENRVKIHFISRDDVFPFVNCYETPQSLGIDRMILASGAVLQFPKMNRLIIDAGTCVTYDFIDDCDRYFGGAISPGLRLRYESLHQFTAKLPLLCLADPSQTIGTTTIEAIHSGVVNGLVHEIDGFINEYLTQNSNFIIILTGGDSDFLAKRLKNTIFANSNFLLESLIQTFQYKIKND